MNSIDKLFHKHSVLAFQIPNYDQALDIHSFRDAARELVKPDSDVLKIELAELTIHRRNLSLIMNRLSDKQLSYKDELAAADRIDKQIINIIKKITKED